LSVSPPQASGHAFPRAARLQVQFAKNHPKSGVGKGTLHTSLDQNWYKVALDTENARHKIQPKTGTTYNKNTLENQTLNLNKGEKSFIQECL
jgi:hypothetical protein